MPANLTPLHRDLNFCAPLSDERASRLCAFIAGSVRGTVVDVGCGWGELLIRLLEANPSLRGLGIDLNAEDISQGRANATARGVVDRLSLIAGDARAHLPQEAGGVVCIGVSQIWGAPVEANQPLDYRSALRALRGLLDRGRPAVYGEGIWTAEPTPAAIKPLAGRADEFVFLPDLLDIIRDCGFEVMSAEQATLEEWDQFETGYTARFVRWLAEHAQAHPDAQTVRERMLRQSDAYFEGYRGVLGMAYFRLLAA